MSLLGIRWTAEPLRILFAATIADGGGEFVAAGAPFANPINQLYFVNLTDVAVFVSRDGVNPEIIMPSGSNLFFDISSNKNNQSGALCCPVGTQWSVTYAVNDDPPTTGAFYISSWYAAPPAN